VFLKELLHYETGMHLLIFRIVTWLGAILWCNTILIIQKCFGIIVAKLIFKCTHFVISCRQSKRFLFDWIDKFTVERNWNASW
jgi:hypothetical protein